MSSRMARHCVPRADFLHEIQHTVRPLFHGWSRKSSRLPALYEHTLQAVTAALEQHAADRTLVFTPVELDEVGVEQIRQSLSGWSKDSLPTECLKDILRVLISRRLVKAPLPRVRFRTPRRLVVDHSAHKMTYWSQWDDLVRFWLQTTLSSKPCLTGDVHAVKWQNNHHEFACSAMFALLIDGGVLRHHVGRHFRFLDFKHIVVQEGWLAIPFSGYQTVRQTSQLRFRVPLGLLAQLFLNRYVLFLLKWKRQLGLPGEPIFPSDYTAQLERNFAHWLSALTRREPIRPAPSRAPNDSRAHTLKSSSTTIVSKFIYSARATLLETLPPFLVASLVGQLRYVPMTRASFARLFLDNNKSLGPQQTVSNQSARLNMLASLSQIYQQDEESPRREDELPPAVASLSSDVERVIQEVRSHLRPLRKGLSQDRLRLIAKQIDQSLTILRVLSRDITDSIDAPESNLRLFFEHVTEMLRGRQFTGLGKLAPATISRYSTGMVDQILLAVGDQNLLALRESNQVGDIVALAMRDYSNQRTRKAIKTQWAAFFSYLHARDQKIPEIDSKDPRLWTTWEGHEYDLLTYDDLDRIITVVHEEEKPREAAVYELVYTLAAYAGLRLHEICGIRIRDLVSTQGQLLLRIPVSKSPAGRRTIPLDLLLDVNGCELFDRYTSTRLDTVRNVPEWQDLPLLTLDDANSRLDEHTLGRKAKKHLATAPFDTTLHDLRHMFASWLLVRWYAARYGTSKDIPIFAHRIFKGPCPYRLVGLFDHSSITSLEATDKYHDPILYLIARLMGHAFPTTTVETYIHTFDLVHKLFLSSTPDSSPHLAPLSPLTQQNASNLLACDDVTANGLIRKAASGESDRYQPLDQECNPNNILIAQRDRIADCGRKKRKRSRTKVN